MKKLEKVSQTLVGKKKKRKTRIFSVHDVLMLRLVPLKPALITRNFRCIDRNCSRGAVSNVVR